MKDFISRQKLGRLATADEIGHLIVYLGSDEVRSSAARPICEWMTHMDSMVEIGWRHISEIKIIIVKVGEVAHLSVCLSFDEVISNGLRWILK